MLNHHETQVAFSALYSVLRDEGETSEPYLIGNEILKDDSQDTGELFDLKVFFFVVASSIYSVYVKANFDQGVEVFKHTVADTWEVLPASDDGSEEDVASEED